MRRLVLSALVLVCLSCLWFYRNPVQFFAGGALINLGYRLQDPLDAYDFEHHEATPAQVWAEFLSQNQAAAAVRTQWPRTARHPVVVMVVCMDARLDTNEIAGDTRRYYYVLRLAGSALAPKEEDMLELAVANGAKVVVFTTHTDCAAEKAAANPESRKRYPALAQAVDERLARFHEFQRRDAVKERVSKGELMVKWVDLDTMNERAIPHEEAVRASE